MKMSVADREINEMYCKKIGYRVCDKFGNEICKTKLKKEAKATIEEFNKIDKREFGVQNTYYIQKL